MDAPALILRLTARAATVSRISSRAPPPHAPPPHAPPSVALPERAPVVPVCSIGASAASRELPRKQDVKGRGRALALAARDLGFHGGLDLAAQDLGFRDELALPFPPTASRRSILLEFPKPAPCFVAAPDAGGALRRGLWVVCRAHPLGAGSPEPTLLHSSSARPGFAMIRRKFAVSRCSPAKSGVTDDEKKNGYFNLNVHAIVGAMVVSVKVITYMSKRLNLLEIISSRVRFPEQVAVAAATAVVLGKSLYAVLKETKEFSEFFLYFFALFKEGIALAATSKPGAPDVGKDDNKGASAVATANGTGETNDIPHEVKTQTSMEDEQ